MTKREQRESAEILERLARAVAMGEVTAPAGFVGRLQGAVSTLKVSAGADKTAREIRTEKARQKL